MSQSPDESVLTLGAIERLYGSYGARCYALARRIVRDRQLAEDVVQEVFAVVCARPERYDPQRGTMATWLMTLTHHKAVDAVRRQERRVPLDDSGALMLLLPDNSPGPDDVVTSAEVIAPVRAALGMLSKAQQQVIVLAYYGGYTQREIAAHLGIPLGTVKSRTVAGMRRLHSEVSFLL